MFLGVGVAQKKLNHDQLRFNIQSSLQCCEDITPHICLQSSQKRLQYGALLNQ